MAGSSAKWRRALWRLLAGAGGVLVLGVIVLAATGNIWIVGPESGRRTTEGQVRLDYVCWGDYTEEAMNRHWIDEFMRLHPNIKVNMILTGGGTGTREKIQTMIAGGAGPDVMYVWPEVFPEFVDKGIYMPLNSHMQRDGISRDLWFPVLIDFYTENGEVYGLPRSWHPYLIFYNKDLFDQAGVPYPDAGWTFDDMIRYGKRLTRDLNGDGITDQYAVGNIPWRVFVWACGGNDFDEEGHCYLDERASIRGIQLYTDLIWKHKISPSPQQQKLTQSAQDMFKTGRMAMFSLGIWSVPDFRQITSFDWDIAIMPTGQIRVTQLVTAGWAVYRRSPNPDAAWELVKYLSGRQAQEYQMRIWRDPSGLKDVFKALMFHEPQQAPHNREAVLESIEFGRFAAPFIGSAEVNTRVEQVLDEAFSLGSEDVAATCREAAEVAARTLADVEKQQ